MRGQFLQENGSFLDDGHLSLQCGSLEARTVVFKFCSFVVFCSYVCWFSQILVFNVVGGLLADCYCPEKKTGQMSSFELFGRPFSTGEEIRENRMESHGHLNIFGANRTESTLRKMLSSEPFTNTDKSHHSPTSPSSALFGENILENFSLQPNFLRRQQALQEQHHRNKRKRKESSLSSCSSSSSLLSLVSSSERRQTSAVSGVAAVGGGDGENPFVVGGREGARKEQCAQQKSEKSLSSSSFRSADLNECSPYASRGTRDSSGNNRSMRQPEVQEDGGGGGDDEHDSPRRKRPKYDYTRDQMFEVNRLLLFSSSAFGVLLLLLFFITIIARRRSFCSIYRLSGTAVGFLYGKASILCCDVLHLFVYVYSFVMRRRRFFNRG